MFEDAVRPDAREILEYFIAQGVQLKVISGDHPQTVAAVARRAGVPSADGGYDARDLPEDRDAMADVLDQHSVFGRVTPAPEAGDGRGAAVAGHDRGDDR